MHTITKSIDDLSLLNENEHQKIAKKNLNAIFGRRKSRYNVTDFFLVNFFE